MPEAYKYTVSWGLPPVAPFAEGLKFSIQADHQEELKNGLDRLFGDGTFDRVSGRLVEATFAPDPTTAASAPASAGATGASTARATAPAPVGRGDTASAYGACPECGVGQIVDKFRRGTGEHFGVGCNNYPNCNYMQSWDRSR